METSQDVATTFVDEENPPHESRSFPDLSVPSKLAEFTSESTVNEIRTCFEIATRETVAAGQSTALFTINAVKQVLSSSSMQSLLAQQPNFQSSPSSAFASEHASSNCQSSSLIAVDAAYKPQEFSNPSWIFRKDNNLSPSTHFENRNATRILKAQNPSIPDTKSTMQTLLANLPKNVQHKVMYKLYMLGDSRDRLNVLKDISEGWPSACSEGTKLDCSIASTLALWSLSNNESVMDVANGKDSGNDSDSEVGLSAGKQLTPRVKYENDEKCSALDFQLKANASEGAVSHLALHLNSKCSISEEPSSNTSHHGQSLHSSELQNSRSSDEMHVRFDNWHLSNKAQQQHTEEKGDLTVANKSRKISWSEREIQKMTTGNPLHACPVCKETFRFSNMLRIHSKHLHNETHPFSCTVCERKFDSYWALTQHRYSHGLHPTYKCEICGQVFDSQPRLVRHHRVFHFKLFGLAPPSRSKIFPLLSVARKRSATRSDSAVPSSGTEEQPFPCVFCGKKFSKKALLSQHMKSHVFSRAYDCETCGQTFNFQTGLAKHMFLHADAARFACSACDLKFSHMSHLRRHKLTHLISADVKLQTKKTPCAAPSSRTKPNPAAMSRRGLKREFSCTFCDEIFDKEISLSHHMKSHEWRPCYECGICSEMFNFQSSLMKHQSEVHSDAIGHTSSPGVSSSH